MCVGVKRSLAILASALAFCSVRTEITLVWVRSTGLVLGQAERQHLSPTTSFGTLRRRSTRYLKYNKYVESRQKVKTT